MKTDFFQTNCTCNPAYLKPKIRHFQSFTGTTATSFVSGCIDTNIATARKISGTYFQLTDTFIRLPLDFWSGILKEIRIKNWQKEFARLFKAETDLMTGDTERIKAGLDQLFEIPHDESLRFRCGMMVDTIALHLGHSDKIIRKKAASVIFGFAKEGITDLSCAIALLSHFIKDADLEVRAFAKKSCSQLISRRIAKFRKM